MKKQKDNISSLLLILLQIELGQTPSISSSYIKDIQTLKELCQIEGDLKSLTFFKLTYGGYQLVEDVKKQFTKLLGDKIFNRTAERCEYIHHCDCPDCKGKAHCSHSDSMGLICSIKNCPLIGHFKNLQICKNIKKEILRG